MCVICYKAKKAKLPTAEDVVAMWNRNPDGAGAMWRNKDGSVGWQKGFMRLGEFQDWLKRSSDYLSDIECAFHFRITTHGGTSKGNCHPFACKRSSNPHILRGVASDVLMHNGIIGIAPRRKDISDSAELALRAGSYESPSLFLGHVNEFLKGSRVILFGREGTKFYGDPFVSHDGLMYSNLHHVAMQSAYGSYYGGFGCVNGFSQDDCADFSRDAYWEESYYGTGGEWVDYETGEAIDLLKVDPESLSETDFVEWAAQMKKDGREVPSFKP